MKKVYKDQFHLFSIFKQQMGLISFTVSLHYNLSPFDSPISSGVNIIECPSRVEEKIKNCLEGFLGILAKCTSSVMFPKVTCMQTLKVTCMQTLKLRCMKTVKVTCMQTIKMTCMKSKQYLMMHAPN